MPAPKGHEPYPGCEKGGRPPIWDDEAIEKEADAFAEWIEKPNSFWFQDFAHERKYPAQYLARFAKKNEKFRLVYEYAQSIQLSLFVKGSMTNKFNPSFTKFVMANTFGWCDRKESRISGDPENPLGFILNQIEF